MPKPCTQKPPTKEDSETLIFASWSLEGGDRRLLLFQQETNRKGSMTLHQMLCLDPQKISERIS